MLRSCLPESAIGGAPFKYGLATVTSTLSNHLVADFQFQFSKPAGTGGVLSVGSVGEQMLYEIGDPASYQLPDVTADFSQVSMLQTGEGVMVKGARGRAPGHNYKISATYMDGYKVRSDIVISLS